MIVIPKYNLFKSFKNNWASYVLILMLLTFSSCNSIIIKENRMSDDAVQNIIGKVKIMKIKTINESKTQKNNGINSNLLINYFNKERKIIRQEYRHDSKYSDTTLFYYHKNILIKSTTTSNSISPVLTVEHKYDKKNNEIAYVAYIDTILDSKILKKYDSRGNIISKKYFGRNDKLRFSELFNIDYKNKYVIVDSYDANGKKNSYYSAFQFDKQGNRVLNEVFYLKLENNICTKNEYDIRGNLLKTYSCKNGETTEYKYTFDKVGNIIRRDKYRNTMYIGSTVMEIIYR